MSVLLRQAHGFEGFGPPVEGAPPTHFPRRHRTMNQIAWSAGAVATRTVTANAGCCEHQVTKITHFHDLDAPSGKTSSRLFQKRRTPSWPR